jgi:SAM-dependent methyltransferase
MGAYVVDGVEVVNTEQAAAWDGHEGDVWTEHADRYDRASRHVWQRFLDADLVRSDDRVLDVGCGTGGPTRSMARVATAGAVTGIDLSTRMLALARERAAAEGLGNTSFVHGDAQVFPFEPEAFDLATSSFGAMFFGDRVAAFANIARAVRPGGRLAMMAWRALPDNEWLMALRGALALGRDLPVPPPDAPTPFSLADPDRVRALLGETGFEDAGFEPIDEPIELGTDAADAYAFAETMGIVEGLTNDLDPDDRATALANVADLMRERETPEGVLIPSAAWIITARRR